MKRLTLAALVGSAALMFPAVAAADPPICHDGVLSNDAGQGCTNDGPYGGAPTGSSSSSSGYSDGAICHDGILSDDRGQGCADGLYERTYGSGSSAPRAAVASSSSSYSSNYAVCHDGILSDDVGHGCTNNGGYVTHSTYRSSTSSSSSSYGGGYSIPSSIVQCESGGNWHAVNPSSGAGGAYQILPSTWAAYGGSGSPASASPAEQSRIAARIYADSGGSAWVCK